MLIHVLRPYRGRATGEQLLQAGRVYDVPPEVGRYLLGTFPDDFREVAPGQVPRREIIRLRLPETIAASLPEALAEAAGDEVALVRVLEGRLAKEVERLHNLENQLSEAKQERDRLLSFAATKEATDGDLKRLEAQKRRVIELSSRVEEAQAAIRGLEKRLGEARQELAKARLAAYCQQFDLQLKEYKERFARFCELACELVDSADALYALGRALDQMRGWIEREAASADEPVEQRYLSGSSALPKPSSLKLDRFLRPDARQRGESIRAAVARFSKEG